MSADPLVICTALPAGHLGAARELAASVRAHRPDARVVVALLDPLPEPDREPSEPFQVIPPDGLPIPDLARQRFARTSAELRALTRPHLLAHLLDVGAGRVVSVEPGTLVTDDPRALERVLARHPVVSLPQITSYGDVPGAFRGALAVSRGDAASRFLTEWQAHVTAEAGPSELSFVLGRSWVSRPLGLFDPAPREVPTAWDVFDNGVRICDFIRRCYRDLGPAAAAFGDPFATAGPHSFFAWLTACEVPGVPRLLQALHAARPDLRAAFPELAGQHRAAFLSWVLDHGAAEHDLDPRLLGPARAAVGWRPVSVRPNPPTEPFGVNVLGYLRSEKGVGEACRATVRSLRAAGVPVALNARVDPGSANRDDSLGPLTPGNPYPVNLFHVNADETPGVVGELAGYRDGRHNVGFWNWELDHFPGAWRDRFADLDEVWAPSSFTRDAIARVSPVPVHRVPFAVAPPRPGAAGRERFGLPRGAFAFLCAFDFHSVAARKNPLAVVEAFRRAFGTRRDVVLVVKASRCESAGRPFAEVLAACGGRPNVRVVRDVLTRPEMDALIHLCDAYVGLHRSEGYGLPLAEAMAAGKPVIATDYSANTDFMTAANSYPVRYRLVELAEDLGPYPRGAVWADPDVDHGAELMRRVVECPDEAVRVAAQGRADIERTLNPRAVGAIIRARLAAIGPRRAAA